MCEGTGGAAYPKLWQHVRSYAAAESENMIVYSATKQQFKDDVVFNQISDIIRLRLREHGVSGGSFSEYNSWHNSLHFMKDVIDDESIPEDANVAIEYQIPRTSRRVDFMIAGADSAGHDNVVIVELKQWTKAEKIDDYMNHSVRAFTGGANRIVNHPSYQAFSYSTFIRNFSEQIQDNDIGVIPCAYLHNYEPQYVNEINDPVYSAWYEEAPFFIRTDVLKLREFIKKYISRRASGGDLRYDAENDRIITDRSKVSKDDKSSGIRSAGDEQAATLIKNTYKTLLTRGQKGCYV